MRVLDKGETQDGVDVVDSQVKFAVHVSAA